MPTSLVTGAAGFIGSHVAQSLAYAGHEVIAVDDLSGGYKANIPAGMFFAECSITDAECMRDLFDEHEPDYVFHLAAYAAEGLSHYIRRFNYTNNVVGSVNLINEAVRSHVKRFVFTSSMAAYGNNQVPFHEEQVPLPEDPYGIAKYAVELDLEAAHATFGLDYTVFRPHSVYGERQNLADRYRNVIGIFFNQLMHDEPMTIFGDGYQTRAFSYIDDVAPIIASSINVPGAANQKFNIGADEPYSVLDLAHAVAYAYDTEPKIVHLPARYEVKHAYTSHEKIREVFGRPLKTPTPLGLGLARMARWAKRQGPQARAHFDEIELRELLPVVWLDDKGT